MFSVSIFFLIFIVTVESRINPYGPTVVGDFTHCIESLIDTNFDKSGVLIFANSQNVSTPVVKIRAQLLQIINDKIKYTIEIMNPEKEVDVCSKYDEKLGVLHIDKFMPRPSASYFIIIMDKYKDFPFIMSKLLRSRSWNPNAQIIIVLLKFNDDKSNINLVELMFTCLFKYNAIDVMVLVPKDNDVRKVLIYTWRAYDPPTFCGYYNETAHNRAYVDNTCSKGKPLRNSTRDAKIPNDMQGCELSVLALEREPFVSRYDDEANMEKDYVSQIARVFNFTMRFNIINSFRGEREDVGQWNGALRELTLKMEHLLMGGIFPDFDVHEDFECSSSYLADSYTWIVPRASHSPPWVSLVISFKVSVWYTAITSFCVCFICWKVLGQLSNDSQYHQSFNHCLLNTWICTLGFCAYNRPTKQSLRLFFCFLNIYCVIFITAYQTKLIDVLKNPTFESQMETVEELVSSGISFGGSEEIHDLFSDSTDFIDKYIYNNWILVDDMAKALTDVAVHRNFSVLASRIELAYVSATTPQLIDPRGDYKYFTHKMNMFSVPLEMVGLRGFPYMKKFSYVVSLFKQCGINTSIIKKYKYFNILRRERILRSLFKNEPEIKPLSLLHLQGGFFALAVGYVGGTFLLILEIIVSTELVKRKIIVKFEYIWKNK